MYSQVIQLYIYYILYVNLHLYIYIYSFFQVLFTYILFSYTISQNIESSSLCYTVGPFWLSILYIAVSVINPKLLIYPAPLSEINFKSHILKNYLDWNIIKIHI